MTVRIGDKIIAGGGVSPIASTEDLGVVKPDGTTITIDKNGVISSEGADKDLSNLSADGKAELIKNVNNLSNFYTLTVPDNSGTVHIDKKGWLCFIVISSSTVSTSNSLYMELKYVSNGMTYQSMASYVVANRYYSVWLPIVPNVDVKVGYSNIGSYKGLRFYYAEGEI